MGDIDKCLSGDGATFALARAPHCRRPGISRPRRCPIPGCRVVATIENVLTSTGAGRARPDSPARHSQRQGRQDAQETYTNSHGQILHFRVKMTSLCLSVSVVQFGFEPQRHRTTEKTKLFARSKGHIQDRLATVPRSSSSRARLTLAQRVRLAQSARAVTARRQRGAGNERKIAFGTCRLPRCPSCLPC